MGSAGVSSEGWTGEGSTSKLIYVIVNSIHSLPMWASEKSSSQHGNLLHQDMGAREAMKKFSTKIKVTSFCFCKLITGVTSSQIAIFYWLEASHSRRGGYTRL